MKKYGILILLFGLAIFFTSCSDQKDADTESAQGDDLLSSHVVTPGLGDDEEVGVMINPNRGYYDVVVVDIDRWELCMNYDRIRSNVSSFTGHMWYQMGSFMFEGSLGGMYNSTWDMLTVTALDSGWDRGHIIYNLFFINATSNDMEGTFVYYEYTNRVNWIDAWLDQGELGDHDAGPYPGGAGQSAVRERAMQNTGMGKNISKGE